MNKQLLTICLVTALLGTPLAAQEAQQGAQQGEEAQAAADPRAAMAAAMAAEGIIVPGQVTTSMGKITLHGMIVAGVVGVMQDNTAVEKTDGGEDEVWRAMPYDPVWTANMARLSLIYENGKYGAYFMLSAEDWDGNPERNYNKISMPYVFVWRSFFDSKLKLTLGKLYSEDFQTRERIWKTEGALNGGWQFSDSLSNIALRAEFKPIEGLNIGFQWDVLPYGQTTLTQGVPAIAESIKEIGIAAEYKSSLFNAVAGVRFDGADGMHKADFYGYLKDYYGEAGYIAGGSQSGMAGPYTYNLAPHFKYRDEVYGTSTGESFSTGNADKPIEGFHRAMFGFNFKGVKNLTAIVDGSFWNMGDFDRFGAGAFSETFKYQITPKFNAGVIFYQQFYGSDVFPDDMVNSPYFRFEPVVAYNLVPNIDASLLGTYAICQDVIDSEWSIKPKLTFTLGGFGAFRVELSYELKATTYTEKALKGATMANGNVRLMGVKGGDAIYDNRVGLSAMWMF